MKHQENLTLYYNNLHKDWNVPDNHISYLEKLKSEGVEPTVIYDIGAAVLHWTKNAKRLWPNAKIIAFEAVREVEDFYKSYGVEYSLGVFTDVYGKELTFYEDPICLGGNSYYRENKAYSPAAEKIYTDSSAKKRIGKTIDSAAAENKFPLPDMVKIDVQGAELDILRGMTNTIKNVKHLIVELQHVEYNMGARGVNESIPLIESMGFKLISQPSGNKYFCGNGPDADYHFVRE
jgi:FkbM family methyltransferase